ncbi:hypothetical protein TRVL_04711 [Trypanosoma vivax]|nr:hypothetical protein TRVL_04711 [Trypanosoma vivax]
MPVDVDVYHTSRCVVSFSVPFCLRLFVFFASLRCCKRCVEVVVTVLSGSVPFRFAFVTVPLMVVRRRQVVCRSLRLVSGLCRLCVLPHCLAVRVLFCCCSALLSWPSVVCLRGCSGFLCLLSFSPFPSLAFLAGCCWVGCALLLFRAAVANFVRWQLSFPFSVPLLFFVTEPCASSFAKRVRLFGSCQCQNCFIRLCVRCAPTDVLPPLRRGMC